MNVRNIKNPKFLKKLKINELEELSNDIRKYIIDYMKLPVLNHIITDLGPVFGMNELWHCSVNWDLGISFFLIHTEIGIRALNLIRIRR